MIMALGRLASGGYILDDGVSKGVHAMTCALVENDSRSKIPRVLSGLLVDETRTDTQDQTPPFISVPMPVETRVSARKDARPGRSARIEAIPVLRRPQCCPFRHPPIHLNHAKSFITIQ